AVSSRSQVRWAAASAGPAGPGWLTGPAGDGSPTQTANGLPPAGAGAGSGAVTTGATEGAASGRRTVAEQRGQTIGWPPIASGNRPSRPPPGQRTSSAMRSLSLPRRRRGRLARHQQIHHQAVLALGVGGELAVDDLPAVVFEPGDGARRPGLAAALG